MYILQIMFWVELFGAQTINHSVADIVYQVILTLPVYLVMGKSSNPSASPRFLNQRPEALSRRGTRVRMRKLRKNLKQKGKGQAKSKPRQTVIFIVGARC